MDAFLQSYFDNPVFKADRKTDMRFNSSVYWWVWWNKTEDILINQYDRIVKRGAKDYLISRGLIDVDSNVISSFED